MVGTRLAARAAAVVAIGLIAACASEPVRPRLVFGANAAPEGGQPLWPPPPEVPRFAYAGVLTGEENFQVDREQRSGSVRFLRWIAGLDERDPQPVVLQRPVAGVVDERGRIYVTDASRQAVFVFDEAAGRLEVWERAVGLRRFESPVGIALGRGEEVLVADAELAVVVRLGVDGAPLGTIGSGLLTRPTGIARDAASRRIFVADTYAHAIKVFDDEGRLLQTFGRRGEAAGEFNYPTYVSLAQGELYVTDSVNARVQVFAADTGEFRRAVGTRGLYVGNLVRPKGVAVDSERNLYVVESYYDNLLVYGPQGEFLMPLGGTGSSTGRFFLPAGVWTDARNRVFVADMFNGRVVVFSFLGGG
jgi:DNA-binding beta-propeller fold protein YncE